MGRLCRGAAITWQAVGPRLRFILESGRSQRHLQATGISTRSAIHHPGNGIRSADTEYTGSTQDRAVIQEVQCDGTESSLDGCRVVRGSECSIHQEGSFISVKFHDSSYHRFCSSRRSQVSQGCPVLVRSRSTGFRKLVLQVDIT